jgi:pilus assembly protein Flp/PilA
MHRRLNTRWGRIADENGAAMVEYALLLGLLAAGCFAAIQAVGSPVSGLFNSMTTAIQSITF